MIIEFLEEAEFELFEAADWYESKETGLGKRFRNEIAHVLDRILEDPMLWRETKRLQKSELPRISVLYPIFHKRG
jgi:hypothetical protein